MGRIVSDLPSKIRTSDERFQLIVIRHNFFGACTFIRLFNEHDAMAWLDATSLAGGVQVAGAGHAWMICSRVQQGSTPDYTLH